MSALAVIGGGALDHARRRVLGIGDLAAVGAGDADVVTTHALGSCVGIALWDGVARVGGMVHAQLPSGDAAQVAREPGRFVDSGWRVLLEAMLALGAKKARLRVTLAGGANPMKVANDVFAIGKRNLTAARKQLWQAGLLVAAEDVGGEDPRNMTLDLASGRTVIESLGRRREL